MVKTIKSGIKRYCVLWQWKFVFSHEQVNPLVYIIYGLDGLCCNSGLYNLFPHNEHKHNYGFLFNKN